jgi:hypothetical protein
VCSNGFAKPAELDFTVVTQTKLESLLRDGLTFFVRYKKDTIKA